jgi:hypothetical protein
MSEPEFKFKSLFQSPDFLLSDEEDLSADFAGV